MKGYLPKATLLCKLTCLFVLSILCSIKSFAQPANNECATAQILTSNTTCITGLYNVINATPSTSIPAGCILPVASARNDVWFSFTATSNSHTVTILNLGTNFTNSEIQLFSGTCAGLTSISCGANIVNATTLTIGTVYYVRVSQIGATITSNGNFNICLTHPTPPANNECAGAITLTSSVSCSNATYDVLNATANAANPLGCVASTATPRNDVWFKFTATANSHSISISNFGSNLTNPEVQVFSGACGSLVSIACNASTVNPSGLTIGSVYFIRVSQIGMSIFSNASFDVCLNNPPPPPANDDCTNAILLNSNTACSSTAGNMRFATNSAPAGLCGGATASTTYDLWYRFQATATTQTISVTNLGDSLLPATTFMQLFSGACGGLTSITCQDVSARRTISGLIIGTFYFVRVYTVKNPIQTPTNSWRFSICIQQPPVNDLCANATLITNNALCTNTAGTLDLATATTLTNGCFPIGTYYDVWYRFVATAVTHTITVSNLGANINALRFQMYSGTCFGLTGLTNCAGGSTAIEGGLTIGNTYFIRVSNVATDPSGFGTVANFNICVTPLATPAPPGNDNCAGASTLVSNTTCSNIRGTLINATASGASLGCGNAASPDVWFRFVAKTAYPTISLSSIGANLTGRGLRIQLFASCGGASLACVSTTSLNVLSVIGGMGLTVGSTYIIRITTNTNFVPVTSGTYDFNICITDPIPTSIVEFSKTYTNITAGTVGGTVNPGDVLEIRGTLVVRGGSIDNVSFYDTLKPNAGFRLNAASIATRTNEGKVFDSFTDTNIDSDAGWYTHGGVGTDTAIQINLGQGSTNVTRVAINGLSRPNLFNFACITLATYRVTVTRGYGTKIKYGGGSFSYRDPIDGVTRIISFPTDSIIVYQSLAICAGSETQTNIVGEEFNGTFGKAPSSAAVNQNRAQLSANTEYGYMPFNPSGPNDYFYGIANNTSQTNSINQLAGPKPGSSDRVFGHWDISGDHTGALTDKGNKPCDSALPINTDPNSAGYNPCGYMYVVNAAYRTDQAFTFKADGVCPNTYYELSSWVKNVCYKCGCDVNGVSSSSGGYIPTAVGDSSGVRPNLAYQINGIDYYTTGDVAYQGTGGTQSGSDTLNKWVRKAFVYQTGPTETSFTLTIRNNAPGGGGNDWALDDIALKTCSPTMAYAPSLTPSVTQDQIFAISDTIRSFFNTYIHYKWQRSTNGGASWVDITGSLVGSPTLVNGLYEYIVIFLIPASQTALVNNGDKYRVLVATTATNLVGTCSSTDTKHITITIPTTCVAGATNYAETPQTGTINWNDLKWSLGHIPSCCENVHINYVGTNVGVDAVNVDITNDICIRNLTLSNTSPSATNKLFTTKLYPSFKMLMNGNVRMYADGAVAQDSCLFIAYGSNSVTINGNTVIGRSGDKAYSILGSAPTVSGPVHYYLKGDTLAFNQQGLTSDKFINMHVEPLVDTAYFVNNTNITPYPNAASFESFIVGDGVKPTTVIATGGAGGQQVAFINDRGGALEVTTNGILILPSNFAINKKGTLSSSLLIRANAALKVGGFANGTTGSNFPANYSTYTAHPNSTVEYFGTSAGTQTVFGGINYGNLELRNATNALGVGRAQKNSTAAITAVSSINVNLQTDFTLGTLGSNTQPITSTGLFNVTAGSGLYCNANVISGAGNFVMGNGSYLGMGHALGITASGATGNMQMVGRGYNTTGNYIYNGLVNQVTGNGLPATINELTIDNNLIVTNSQNVLANGIALMKQGTYDLLTTQLASNGANGIINSTGGKIKADKGFIRLSGTSGTAQTLSGNWFIGKNVSTLINANTIGFTNSAVANDSLLISHALLYGNGTTNSVIRTNNNLTILSRDTGTARFGEIVSGSGNSIIGTVNVERFVPNTRKWRLFAWPTNSSQTAQQSWMEGALTPNANPKPGYGCIVTDEQASWASGNFDSRSISGPSVKYYVPATDLFVGIPNTRTYAMNTNSAYYNYVRGDRSALPTPFTNSFTVLRTTGTLKTGLVNYPVSAGLFAMVGNPYASAIDVRKLLPTNLTAEYYVWDPRLTGAYGLGAYQLLYKSGAEYRITPGGGSYPTAGSIVDTIESGMGLLVRSSGAAGTLVFNEDAKTINARPFARGAGTAEAEVIFTLLSIADPGVNTLVDGAMGAYDNIYSNDVNFDDALKLTNTSENVSFKRNGTLLAIERRKDVVQNDTMYINMTGLRIKRYQWDIKVNNMENPGRTAFLIDKHLNTSTPIALNGNTPVLFDVTSTAGTYAPDRFMIVFKQLQIPTTLFTNITASRNVDKTIKVNWAVANEVNVANYSIEQSNDGTTFTAIAVQAAQANNNTNTSYQATDATASTNQNYYRIKLNSTQGAIAYSAIAMVNKIEVDVAVSETPSIKITPNVIQNGQINVYLNNQPKGIYSAQIINALGQIIITKTFNVQNANEKLLLNAPQLSKGNYQLKVANESKILTTLPFVIK